MTAALLLVLALVLIASGVGMTLLIATRVPLDTLTTAQEHGRFAGLGSVDKSEGVARARPVNSGARGQQGLAHA
jgi:hypothetical protein